MSCEKGKRCRWGAQILGSPTGGQASWSVVNGKTSLVISAKSQLGQSLGKAREKRERSGGQLDRRYCQRRGVHRDERQRDRGKDEGFKGKKILEHHRKGRNRGSTVCRVGSSPPSVAKQGSRPGRPEDPDPKKTERESHKNPPSK